jgi:hypothetical protein
MGKWIYRLRDYLIGAGFGKLSTWNLGNIPNHLVLEARTPRDDLSPHLRFVHDRSMQVSASEVADPTC